MISTPQRHRRHRRSYAKSAATHQRILDAAAKALADHGYAEVKLSEIAKEAGTRAGSLYYYYPSRDELMKAVLLAAVDRLSEFTNWLADDEVDSSPIEGIARLVRQAVEQLATMRKDDYLRAYLRNYNQVPESIRSILKSRRRELRRKLSQLMREAQADGQIPSHVDPQIATQFITGAINWVGLWFDPAGAISTQQIADSFVDLLMNGLAGKSKVAVAAMEPIASGKRRAANR